jgi:hypothetical protein
VGADSVAGLQVARVRTDPLPFLVEFGHEIMLFWRKRAI